MDKDRKLRITIELLENNSDNIIKNDYGQEICQITPRTTKNAIELLKSQASEIRQLKQQQTNTTRRIEEIIEQHRYSSYWNTRSMVDGLRIALEIMNDEQNKNN